MPAEMELNETNCIAKAKRFTRTLTQQRMERIYRTPPRGLPWEDKTNSGFAMLVSFFQIWFKTRSLTMRLRLSLKGASI